MMSAEDTTRQRQTVALKCSQIIQGPVKGWIHLIDIFQCQSSGFLVPRGDKVCY